MTRDGPVKSNYDTHVCHSRESGNPLFQILTSSWIPAFAGMTTICEAIIRFYDFLRVHHSSLSPSFKLVTKYEKKYFRKIRN